jgi:hypothetical protein
MRCSQDQWRTGGIRTCGANPSLQKTRIWKNWSLVVIISSTYNTRTLQSPYRMQNIFTERTEAFCMQLLPGLRNFTSTGICSKRRDLYLSDIWREFVGMEVKQAESSMFILSLLKLKDSCTLLTQTSTGKI